jgi:hypothetical protein
MVAGQELSQLRRQGGCAESAHVVAEDRCILARSVWCCTMWLPQKEEGMASRSYIHKLTVLGEEQDVQNAVIAHKPRWVGIPRGLYRYSAGMGRHEAWKSAPACIMMFGSVLRWDTASHPYGW